MAIQTGIVKFHRYHCLSACNLGTWQKGIADIKNDLIAKNHPHNNFFLYVAYGSRGVHQTQIWVALKKAWEPLA